VFDGGLGLCEGVSGREASNASRLMVALLLRSWMCLTSRRWAGSAGCILASFVSDVECVASVELSALVGGCRGIFLKMSGVFLGFVLASVGAFAGCTL
jgi:hypothetical protein